ncbi:MAG: hypothetical protein DCC55_39375 [Chloroflexi bacterium]|nr:MAG: hypothetical protein DCC55_39375 [Chloroflexota bacterium]
MMQVLIDSEPVSEIQGALVTQTEAKSAAAAYVATHLDPTFEVTGDLPSRSQPGDDDKRWRFFVSCVYGPLASIFVDAKTGTVIPLTATEIGLIHEKAAILRCRSLGVLPVNDQGYVLGEYARKRAQRYLSDAIAMFFEGADPVLVDGEQAVWQVTIVFKMYEIGPVALGTLDIDALTGEPFPLTTEQIKQIKERANAIVKFHAQQAKTPL